MHLISFDASPRQLGKIRSGRAVRIKRGSGFNLVVNPTTYRLVSRAFSKNKGMELKLSPEELEANQSLSPEQHDALSESIDKTLFEHLPFAEGGSIFKKAKKALYSKTAKKIGRELRPVTRIMKDIAKEKAHEKIAEAHMAGAERYGSDPRMMDLINASANLAHEKTARVGADRAHGGALYDSIKKALYSKGAKKLGRELRPVTRIMKDIAKEKAHQKIAEAHMAGAERYGDDPAMASLLNATAGLAHEKTASVGADRGRRVHGYGLGCGLEGYEHMNAHDALRLAGLASANANHMLAKMHNATVHGQLTQPPIKRYWDDPLAPRSRGYGLHNNLNLIRGRGSMLSQDDILPPALQSQPFGANYHMQFFLPPQYQKYNDGTDVEGRGLYAGRGLYV
jgi:hypothetical protein